MRFQAPKLRLYPTVVGINRYGQGPARPLVQLQCAERDAQRITDFLREENEAFETISFQPFLGSEATADRVRKELRLRFANTSLTALDVIFFYFAGHGIVTADNEAFLCCYDASPRDPTNGGLRLDDIYNRMQQAATDATVMLVLDACYSGSIADPNIINQNASQQMRHLLSGMQPFGSGARIILAAAHANQGARENPMLDEGGAGVFTSELLRGWRLGAAQDKSGAVTPGTLSDYLQGQFSGGGDQQPVTFTSAGTVLKIGQFVPPAPGESVTQPGTRPRGSSGKLDVGAEKEVYKPPKPKPDKEPHDLARRRRLLITGAGVGLALLAACTVLTLVSSFVFTLWYITAITLTLVSIPLAARLAPVLAIPTVVIALVQVVALIGMAHIRYGLGAHLPFLDALAQYSWLAVVIFCLHALFITVYGAWVIANMLWTS